jgi:N-acetyl-beta-hexosaminidase
MSLSVSCQWVKQGAELCAGLTELSFLLSAQRHTGVNAEVSRLLRGRNNYAAALSISAHDYTASLQLRARCLPHRNEEGFQTNMEDKASHVAAYKLARRADKAQPLVGLSSSFSSGSAPTILIFAEFAELHDKPYS